MNLVFTFWYESMFYCQSYIIIIIIFSGSAAKRRLWPPHSRGFLIRHNDVPQSVGLLWMSDQLIAETSTWQHTTQQTNIHAPGGIWTHDRSRRAAVDLHLRLCEGPAIIKHTTEYYFCMNVNEMIIHPISYLFCFLFLNADCCPHCKGRRATLSSMLLLILGGCSLPLLL
jgi:hypothetical protein